MASRINTTTVFASVLLLASPSFAQQMSEANHPNPVASLEPVPAITPQPETLPAKASNPRSDFLGQLRRRLGAIGPEYAIFRPTTAKTANRFGSQWQGGFGINFGRIPEVRPELEMDMDTGFFFNRSGKNRVYLVPVNLGARYGISLGRGAIGYAGLYAGYAGANLRADPEGVRAGWRFAPSRSALVGVHLGYRSFIEYRYYSVNRIRGFDFSGSSIGVGYRF